MDDRVKVAETADQPAGPLLVTCLACRQTFEAERPSRRICPACHAELDRTLEEVLTQESKPGGEPLKILYSVPRRRL